MNFFEYQDKAYRHTKLLLFYFVLAIILIVLAVNAAVYGILFQTELMAEMRYDKHLQSVLWQYLSAGVLAVIFLGTLFKLFMLRHGGRSVAEMVQARRVLSETQDPKEQRLIHIVEEMAIASGVSMPMIYIMDQEQAINAFVAGTKPTDTVLVVTKGMLDALNRDELQGVIGHEFSHIFNGDMQINVRLIGILAGILAIGQVGRYLLRSSGRSTTRRSRSKGGSAQGGIALIAIALFLIGYIGLFFGALIKAAISRQRELLADASSVQYTRNPEGIAGALIQIKRHQARSQLSTKYADDISHMCFGESVRYFISLFNTHPPLDMRIKRLDANGALEAKYLIEKEEGKNENITAKEESKQEKAFQPLGLITGLALASSLQITPQQVSAAVGHVADEAVQRGAYLYSQIPDSIRNMAHDQNEVRILLLSFLISKEDTWQIQAKHLIEQKMGAAQWEAVLKTISQMETLSRSLYLPIVEIGIPALMQNDDATIISFLSILEALSRVDSKITPFEFSMVQLINHRIRPKMPKASYSKFDPVLSEIALLLSFILAASKMSKADRDACFRAVYSKFTKKAAFLDASDLKPAKVADALVTLNGLIPSLKQTLIEGIALCVIRDGKIEIEESELLRTIAACLDCPIPPLLV